MNGHCYKNQIQHLKVEKDKQDESKLSSSEIAQYLNMNILDGNYSSDDELSLDYLPNEVKFSSCFQNNELESIIKGHDTQAKKQIVELFKAVTLCHQINIVTNPKQTEKNQNQFISVYKDEIAALEFVSN